MASDSCDFFIVCSRNILKVCCILRVFVVLFDGLPINLFRDRSHSPLLWTNIG